MDTKAMMAEFEKKAKEIADTLKGSYATKADVDKFNTDVSALRADIKGLMDQIASYDTKGNRPGAGASGMESTQAQLKEFWDYTRKGGVMPDYIKTLTVNNPEAMGYVAPPEIYRSVWERMRVYDSIRQDATVMNVSSSMLEIPVERTFGDAYWVGEIDCAPESDRTVQMAKIPVDLVVSATKISMNLIDDAMFNIDDYVTRKMADDIGYKTAQAFVVGDGVGKPHGFVNDDEVPVAYSGSANGFTNFDALIDAWAELGAGYLPNAKWYMNTKTVALLRKIKDSQGRMLWQEPVQAGAPATLLGFPVRINSFMPDPVAGNVPITFGDMSRGYVIAERKALTIQRDDVTLAGCNQVKIFGKSRVGGQVILPEALLNIKIGVEPTP